VVRRAREEAAAPNVLSRGDKNLRRLRVGELERRAKELGEEAERAGVRLCMYPNLDGVHTITLNDKRV